jgi:hypothetical protein
MKIKKNDVRKIKNATEAELEKLKQEYAVVAQNIHTMSNTGLILFGIVGLALLFYFRNGFFEFLGLVGFMLFVYAFYTLANRAGHREGYLDGYYEASHRQTDTRSDASIGLHKEEVELIGEASKLKNNK